VLYDNFTPVAGVKPMVSKPLRDVPVPCRWRSSKRPNSVAPTPAVWGPGANRPRCLFDVYLCTNLPNIIIIGTDWYSV